MGEIAGQMTEIIMVCILVLHQLQPDRYKKLSNCLELLDPVQFVAPDDSISDVIKAMVKSVSRRVLVKADGRKLLGIISPKDLLTPLLMGDGTMVYILRRKFSARLSRLNLPTL